MNDALSAMYGDLELAIERLKLISAHDALILLKSCLGGPKFQYILRTSPCCGHSVLAQFDDLRRSAVTKICNTALTDDQWIQASLPVWSGVWGFEDCPSLHQRLFLASAAGIIAPSRRKFFEIAFQPMKT